MVLQFYRYIEKLIALITQTFVILENRNEKDAIFKVSLQNRLKKN